jgi:hypothetical protein
MRRPHLGPALQLLLRLPRDPHLRLFLDQLQLLSPLDPR